MLGETFSFIYLYFSSEIDKDFTREFNNLRPNTSNWIASDRGTGTSGIPTTDNIPETTEIFGYPTDIIKIMFIGLKHCQFTCKFNPNKRSGGMMRLFFDKIFFRIFFFDTMYRQNKGKKA